MSQKSPSAVDVGHRKVDVIEVHCDLHPMLKIGLPETQSRASPYLRDPTSPSLARPACRGSPRSGVQNFRCWEGIGLTLPTQLFFDSASLGWMRSAVNEGCSTQKRVDPPPQRGE